MPDTILDPSPGSTDAMPSRLSLQKGMTALIPFTPVAFTGQYAWLAWSRAGIYGAIGYALWKNNRSLAYIALGAAAFGVATSLMSTSFSGTK